MPKEESEEESMASDKSAQNLNLLYSELLVLLKQEEELRKETQRKLEKS